MVIDGALKFLKIVDVSETRNRNRVHKREVLAKKLLE